MNRRRMIACAGAAALALATSPSRAQEPAAPDAVVLITLDGARTEEIFGGLDLDVLKSTLKPDQQRRGLADLQALLGRDARRAAPEAAAVLLDAGHRAGLDRRQPRARQRRALDQQALVLVSRLRGDPARPGVRRGHHVERSGPQPARDRARAAAARLKLLARRRSRRSRAGTSSTRSPSTPRAPRRSTPATSRSDLAAQDVRLMNRAAARGA